MHDLVLASARHHDAFVAVFALFVLLSLVLIGFVVRFAVKLDRERKAAAAAARTTSRRRRRRTQP